MAETHPTLSSPARWKGLLRASAGLGLLMLLLIPAQMAVYLLAPPPTSVEGFFALYAANGLLGLLSLDFLYLLNNGILIFLYLSLAVLLYSEKPSLTAAGLALGLIGVAAYYPSNPCFEMLTLSSRYAGAAAAEQARLLAAGEALLAGYTGTAFNVYYVFNALALLCLSGAMLHSRRLDRATAVWGLLAGALMAVPSTAGLLGKILSLLSLVPWAVFLVRISLRFLRSARTAEAQAIA